jgi:hypothetical protein
MHFSACRASYLSAIPAWPARVAWLWSGVCVLCVGQSRKALGTSSSRFDKARVAWLWSGVCVLRVGQSRKALGTSSSRFDKAHNVFCLKTAKKRQRTPFPKGQRWREKTRSLAGFGVVCAGPTLHLGCRGSSWHRVKKWLRCVGCSASHKRFPLVPPVGR